LYVPFSNNFLQEIKNSQSADILLSHIGLNEAVLQSGLSKVDKISISDIAKFKLALLGHYHRPQNFSNENTSVWYAGSLISKDWNDKNETKRFLVYDTETLEIESVNIECGIPRFIEYIITDITDKVKIFEQAEKDKR